jgi:Peptidase_C39 like family
MHQTFNLLVGSMAQSYYVGIPSQNFDYVAAPQKGSQWCWAASLQMIFNYYGVAVTQEQIVDWTYGADPYSGYLPDWPASLQTITDNLNHQHVDNNNRSYTVQASVTLGVPSTNYLVQELSQHRPVLVSYVTSPESAHAVVLTGCSYQPTINGPLVETLIVRDPGNCNVYEVNPGRREYTGISLANLIDAHWYIRIY